MLILGDVTGHGAPSAIVTGATKGACDLARMGMRATLRPSQLMRMLNRILREATRGEYMMTAVALRVASGGGACAVTNAGHQSPLLVHDGQVTTVQAVRDPPLGSSESHAYGESEIAVVPGDMIVAYTDGVSESENPAGAVLGERVLRQLVQDNAAHGPARMRDAIRAAVVEHQGACPSTDDACLVVAAIR
jgi:sigma-B regulation protein RsbU (phosphoserine phosphatase)